jgi:lysozyme
MKCFGLLMLGITLNAAAVLDAKIYSRCQLAKELYNNGIPKTFISNCKREICRPMRSCFNASESRFSGVCLSEAEAGADSSKVIEHPNLSTSYGVFQINSKEWCRKGRKGGECGIRCEGN